AMQDISAPMRLRKLACRCRDCGSEIPVTAERPGREFCSATCRSAYHNRRKQRGADLYDLFMAMRFDREEARVAGTWSLLCRMAAQYRAEDERERPGLKSWEPVSAVKSRHPQLSAICIMAVSK